MKRFHFLIQKVLLLCCFLSFINAASSNMIISVWLFVLIHSVLFSRYAKKKKSNNIRVHFIGLQWLNSMSFIKALYDIWAVQQCFVAISSLTSGLFSSYILRQSSHMSGIHTTLSTILSFPPLSLSTTVRYQ